MLLETNTNERASGGPSAYLYINVIYPPVHPPKPSNTTDKTHKTRTQVATFIVQKILLDEMGLNYICATAERFFAVCWWGG